MTNPPFIDLDQLMAVQLELPPPTQLQREIEELGGREIQQVFLNLQHDAAKRPSTDTLSCSRMAIALAGGPGGEVYSVLVILRRQPPRD